MTGSMLIFNGNIVTWDFENQILPDHALFIDSGIIKDLGPQTILLEKYHNTPKLDAQGQYIMPGNICAHTHFYGAFARGMSIPGMAPKDFPEILTKLWWSLDKALQKDDVYFSALVCLVDAIRHGTTTLIDHHASPNSISGSLDRIAQAVEEAGLRSVLCYEVTDRDGSEKANEGILENIRFIKSVRGGARNNKKIGAMFGLHASMTLSDETLIHCREAVESLGEDVGFHIHVAEHPADQYDSLEKYGTRVVDRLYKHQLLGPDSIAVHCVHVDAKEIALLAKTGTWVTHQPRSNMNNAVGLPPIDSFLRAGVKVCLGNDGFSNTQWAEWKSAYLGHKLHNLDPQTMSALNIAQMAIYNNAELVSRVLPGEPLGRLIKGARADVIFVDYHPFTPLTKDNLPWHIVFGFDESMVTTTIVAGELLMKDRNLISLDEDRIAYEARKLSSQVWDRYHGSFKTK